MKRILDIISHEFVYGAHLTSLGITAIVWSVAIIAKTPDDWPVYLLTYLTFQIVYNQDHLLEDSHDENANPERTKYLLQTKTVQASLLTLYGVLFLVTAAFTTRPAAILALTIVVAGIVYTRRLKGLTRIIMGFKNLYVSLFIASVVFLIPLHHSLDISNITFILLFGFIFIRAVLNTVFFDIKDTESDRSAQLKTLPVVWGENKTIWFLHMLNNGSALFIVVSVLFGFLPGFFLMWLLIPLLAFYYLTRVDKLNRRQLRSFVYILLDGDCLLWPLMLMLGKIVMR